jgi:signal transduction histidine kinase
MMTPAAPRRIALRLHIVLALLTTASATGSALFLMYLARPYIVGQEPQDVAALGGLLLRGTMVAGVLAALVGLVFGMLTSRRIRALLHHTEALVHTDAPQVSQPATDELDALQQAFGQLTLSIDRFVRDSEILARLPQGLLFVGPGGELLDYNNAAECILGFSLALYRKQGIWEPGGLFPEGPENEQLKALCQQAAGTAELVVEGEIYVRPGAGDSPPGPSASCLLDVTLRRWQRDTDAGTLIMFQDASAKQRIREQLRQADQLAFLGGLAAQFSHQVRTPLTSVRGLLELLQADAPPTAPQQEYFDRIMRGLHRLDRLADSLLSLAHATPRAQKAVHLPHLLDNVLSLMQATTPQSIHINTDYAPALPLVSGDPYLLSEAFTNLMQNALEATPPDGEVTIQAQLVASQSVQVRMQNSGSGIPEELRERIFEPFFSSKREGTGLGLTIARRLIESHGGRLSVESDGFSWSCFIVDLPI